MANVRIKLLIPLVVMAAFSLAAILFVSFMQYQDFQRQVKQLTRQHAEQLKALLRGRQERNNELIELLQQMAIYRQRHDP